MCEMCVRYFSLLYATLFPCSCVLMEPGLETSGTLHTQHWRSGPDSLHGCRGSHSSLCRKHSPLLSHLPGKALPLSKCVFGIRKLWDAFCSAERLPHTVLQEIVRRKASVHLIGQCEHRGLRKASVDRSAWQSRQSDTSK